MNASKMTFEQLCELFSYTPKNRRLTTEEAAHELGIARATLETKRVHGTGPRYFQVPGSKRIFYVERDILEFMASGARTSTSERAPIAAVHATA